MKEFKGTVNGVDYTEVEDYKDAVRTLAAAGELESAHFEWIEKKDEFMKTLNGKVYTSIDEYERAVQNLLDEPMRQVDENTDDVNTETVSLRGILFPQFIWNPATNELSYSQDEPQITDDPESVKYAIETFVDTTGDQLKRWKDILMEEDNIPEAIKLLNQECSNININLNGMMTNTLTAIKKLSTSSSPEAVKSVKTLYNIIAFTSAIMEYYELVKYDLALTGTIEDQRLDGLGQYICDNYTGESFMRVHKVIDSKIKPRPQMTQIDQLNQLLSKFTKDEIRQITESLAREIKSKQKSAAQMKEVDPQKEVTFETSEFIRDLLGI